MFLRRHKNRRSERSKGGVAGATGPAPPAKDEQIYRSTEEQLTDRLRRLRLPEPPPEVRERSLRRYEKWLNSQQSSNRWRD